MDSWPAAAVTVLSRWGHTIRAVLIVAVITHTTSLDHMATHLIDLLMRLLA